MSKPTHPRFVITLEAYGPHYPGTTPESRLKQFLKLAWRYWHFKCVEIREELPVQAERHECKPS